MREKNKIDFKACLNCKFFSNAVIKNEKFCLISGRILGKMNNCPFNRKSVYFGNVGFSLNKGNYVISRTKLSEHNNVNEKSIIFDYDMLMKYVGKKIKLTIEIIDG